jgi:threonine/homoserine/homoserine lactone efflux protein
MGQAIGDVLPMAVGVAISPVPIIAIVLMLGTPRARSNGPAFTLGWLIGLAVAGGILLALASGNAQEDGDEPATWVSVVKLLFGVLFVLIAARTWHSRPRGGEEAAMPKWMQAIDRFGAGKAFGMGVLLSALNPKNLALTIAAAAAIAQVGISTGEEIGTLAIFIMIGSLSILAPLAIYFALGDRATTILGELKDWMAANNATIMTVLLLVLGAKLLGDGIAGLS